MPHKEVIEDMREGCECERAKYCPLEILIIANRDNDRLFEQHKCIEKFKYEENQKIKDREMSWDEAYQLWVERGYAKTFAEVYSPTLKNKTMYNRIMKRNGNGKN